MAKDLAEKLSNPGLSHHNLNKEDIVDMLRSGIICKSMGVAILTNWDSVWGMFNDDELEKFTHSKYPSIRAHTVEYIKDKSRLNALIDDKHISVRKALAAYGNAEHVEKLLHDKDIRVLCLIADRLVPPANKEETEDDDLADDTEDQTCWPHRLPLDNERIAAFLIKRALAEDFHSYHDASKLILVETLVPFDAFDYNAADSSAELFPDSMKITARWAELCPIEDLPKRYDTYNSSYGAVWVKRDPKSFLTEAYITSRGLVPEQLTISALCALNDLDYALKVIDVEVHTKTSGYYGAPLLEHACGMVSGDELAKFLTSDLGCEAIVTLCRAIFEKADSEESIKTASLIVRDKDHKYLDSSVEWRVLGAEANALEKVSLDFLVKNLKIYMPEQGNAMIQALGSKNAPTSIGRGLFDINQEICLERIDNPIFKDIPIIEIMQKLKQAERPYQSFDALCKRIVREFIDDIG